MGNDGFKKFSDGYIETGVHSDGNFGIESVRNPFAVNLHGEGNQKAVFTEAFWLAPPWGRPRNISYPELEPYEKSEWVQMCIQHVMDSVVSCDYNIIPTNEDKIIQSHVDEVKEFFKSKTWQESWQTGLRRMLPDLLLYDCGVFVKVFPEGSYDDDQMLIKSEDGKEDIKKQKLKINSKPIELVARDGRSFLKDCDLFGYTKQFFQYSWIAPHAKPIAFNKEELIYISMRPQSRSPYGIAPLEIIKNIVDYLTSSVNANRKYWENGMFIGGQIDHPDVTDIDEMQERAEMYAAELKGEQNYNKWLLTFGGTKITPLAFTNQEMDWIQASELFGRIVFAIFKVTPSELGFTDGMNHATAQVQSEIYKSKGVQNILGVLEEFINREIIWKHFYTDIEFKFDSSLDLGDKQAQTQIDHTQLEDGVTTINAIRNRDGEELYEDKLFNQPFAHEAIQMKSMEEEGEPEDEYDEDPEMNYENAIGIDDLEGEK